MNTLTSKERLELRALCLIVNSDDFKKLFAKSQIETSTQKPINFSITFEEMEAIFEKASEVNDDNVNTTTIPNNFVELMPYLFSDISYEKSEKIARNFLVTNLVNSETPLMNRGTHTLVVTILSILTAKKVYLGKYDTIMTGIIALSHDIGHFPFAHTTEEAIEAFQEYLKSDKTEYSHEKLSAKVVGKMLRKAQDDIINAEINLLRNKISMTDDTEEKNKLTNELNSVVNNYMQITGTIREGQLAHSNSRYPETPEGIPEQIVRIMDKVAYVFHDLVDGIKKGAITNQEIEDAIKIDAKASIIEKLERTKTESFSQNKFKELSDKMINLPIMDRMLFCVRKMHLVTAYNKNIVGMDPYLWRMINKSLKRLTRSKISNGELRTGGNNIRKGAAFAAVLMFEQIQKIYEPFINDSNSKEINEKIMNIVVSNLRFFSDWELVQYLNYRTEEAKKLSRKILNANSEEENQIAYMMSNALRVLTGKFSDDNKDIGDKYD